MGNFAENLNLGNRFRPPPEHCESRIIFLTGYFPSNAYLAHVANDKQVAKDEGRGCVEL